MSKLIIVVPVGRRAAGRGVLIGSDGKLRIAPFRVLATAGGTAATRHGNPGRDWRRPFGDPPTGSYVVGGALPPSFAGPRAKAGDVRLGALVLSPVGGNALEALRAGRTRFLVHGGPPDEEGRLRSTFGGLRVSDADLATLLAAVNQANADADPVSSVEIEETSTPGWKEGSLDEVPSSRNPRRGRPRALPQVPPAVRAELGFGRPGGRRGATSLDPGRRAFVGLALLTFAGMGFACAGTDGVGAGGPGGDDGGGPGGGYDGGVPDADAGRTTGPDGGTGTADGTTSTPPTTTTNEGTTTSTPTTTTSEGTTTSTPTTTTSEGTTTSTPPTTTNEGTTTSTPITGTDTVTTTNPVTTGTDTVTTTNPVTTGTDTVTTGTDTVTTGTDTVTTGTDTVTTGTDTVTTGTDGTTTGTDGTTTGTDGTTTGTDGTTTGTDGTTTGTDGTTTGTDGFRRPSKNLKRRNPPRGEGSGT